MDPSPDLLLDVKGQDCHVHDSPVICVDSRRLSGRML